MSSTSQPDQADLIFGKYQINKRLAAGGMGEIFLAKQTGVAGFNRFVILKSLLPQLANNTKVVDDFLDEARIAATLNHPNIVSIYEVGAWEGVYFIAMEYIRGVAILELIQKANAVEKTIPHHISAQIIHDAALGLAHAHRARDVEGAPMNIVHRDISPQNIMVRTDGVTKVVDFGIAKAANRVNKTATGLVKGKLGYMAPEQIKDAGVDPRCDLYSLGIVFWEMLAGKRYMAKGGRNELDVLRAMITEEPAPLSSLIPDIEPSLEDIVVKMTRLEPNKRFPDGKALASEISKYLDKVEFDESEIEDFVNQMAKEQIESATKDLASSPENFMVSLKRPGHSNTEILFSASTKSAKNTDANQQSSSRDTPPKRQEMLIAGLILMVLLIVGGVIVGINRNKAPSSQLELIPLQQGSQNETLAVLELQSEPLGAEIFLNDTKVGITPQTLSKLRAETKYRLRVRHPKHEDAVFQVTLKPNENRSMFVQLISKKVEEKSTTSSPRKKRPKAPPRETKQPMTFAPSKAPGTDTRPAPAPAPSSVRATSSRTQGEGFLSLDTNPWTEVNIDGEPYGVTPIFKLRLKSGPHLLILTNQQAGIRHERTIEIKPGETMVINEKLGR